MTESMRHLRNLILDMERGESILITVTRCGLLFIESDVEGNSFLDISDNFDEHGFCEV